MPAPTDTFFTQQWHLNNSSGLDLNLDWIDGSTQKWIWDYYTGAGVKVAVYDDGIQYSHPDLAPNYRANLHVTINGSTHDPLWQDVGQPSDDFHGTAVAGVIAAARNNVGVVGIAYNAQIAGVDILDENFDGGAALPDARVSNAQKPEAFLRLRNFDVSNHSYGNGLTLLPNSDGFAQGVADAAANGRGGLGSIVVKAAMNERASGGNSTLDGKNNALEAVIVGATEADGKITSYSNPGANLLVSAFGSPVAGTIVTTDIVGNSGFNTTGSSPNLSDPNYTNGFNGTSAATPMVSGIVALMLEANPNLGWRDVQEILSMTARHVGSTINAAPTFNEQFSWRETATSDWNGGKQHYSEDYGFGLVDGGAAVRLAKNWLSDNHAALVTGNLESGQTGGSFNSAAVSNANPVSIPNGTGTASITFNFAPVYKLDAVQLRLGWGHGNVNELEVTLTGPSGSTVTLMDNHGTGAFDWGVSNTTTTTLTVQGFRGELSSGTWTLNLKDTTPGANFGAVVSADLILWGTSNTADDRYVYTDEFDQRATGDPSRKVLKDTDGGNDTVNFSALTSGITLNANTSGSGTGVVDGTNITVQNGTVIENVIGTWLNDTIAGNEVANRLFGSHGNDNIVGWQGNDHIEGGPGNDTLNGYGEDDFVNGDEGKDTLFGSAGNDTIFGGGGEGDDDTLYGELGNDKLDGGAGNDTLIGGGESDGSQTDILVGGAGNDTYHLDLGDLLGNGVNWSGHVAETANGGTDTVVAYYDVFELPAFFENLTLANGKLFATGNALNNTLTGNSINNVLNGDAGDDTLDGAAGDDDMSGGTHNDTFKVDNTADRVYENPNEGNDTVLAGVSYVLATGASIELLATTLGSSTNAINLTGNELANTIVGNNGVNTLDGSTGVDRMFGLNGNDTYFVDNTADKVFEDNGFGNDTVRTNVSFTLAAGESIEALKTLSASSTGVINLTGNEFNNAIEGNGANNILNGGVGVDTLTGHFGNDTYYIDRATDVVQEDADRGTDNIRTSVSFTLSNSQWIETLQTLSASSTTVINLTGNNSNNIIIGNDADNILNGDAGADTMHGNFGDDIFHVDNVNDNVIEIAGRGNDTVRAGVSYKLDPGTSVETLRTTSNGGTAAINLTGNELANALVGNNGNNSLNGAGGVDTMAGSLGNDTYFVGSATDKIDELANQGTDNVRASVSYVLAAGEAVETLQR